jgi:hypothetical protein
LTPDKGFNYSGPARIARMVEYFDDEADLATDNNVAMNVDIIGFSRGAAQARDFANRVVANTTDGWYRYKDKQDKAQCQKVNFRFMGLWDTVLSTNNSGYSYNLDISNQFKHVAQAVAMNEYRGNIFASVRPDPTNLDSMGAFPLESIMGGAVPAGQIRIERGFVGSHADIGGGFAQGENQLAQVALLWMVKQASDAGVVMNAPDSTIIANPIIHDKSNNIQTGKPGGFFAEDRRVRYRGGTTVRQRAMTGAALTYAQIDSNQFIQYTDRAALPRSTVPGQESNIMTNQTGTINMQAYRAWLVLNGYDINLTIQ